MKTSKSILLVEDDKDDQSFFIEALREIENATLFDIANNGKEALEKLKNPVALPDLIFMDVNMPVMNGIDCLKEIRKTPELNKVPVVILSTAVGLSELVRKYCGQGFIKKPFESNALRKQIEHVINLDFTLDGQIAGPSA